MRAIQLDGEIPVIVGLEPERKAVVSSRSIESITWSEHLSMFIAVQGGNMSQVNKIETSSDGITWTNLADGSGSDLSYVDFNSDHLLIDK